MTNKRLLKEIDEWEKENIIDAYAADRLRERYSTSGKVTILTILSILSSVLIGAGVILIFATNWGKLPLLIKAFISFLPMISGQAAAMFTVIKKYENTVVRECTSIFSSAGVFATLAMVSNTFDLSANADAYILICSVLILPIIYVLSCVSPLVVYYAGVLFYTLRNTGDADIIKLSALGALLVAGMLAYLRIENEETFDQRRAGYVAWLNVIASFVFVIAFIEAFDIYANAFYLAYFALIFGLSPTDSEYFDPFSFFGIIGSVVNIGIFALGHSWYAAGSELDFFSQFIEILPTLIIAFAALILTLIRGINKHKLVVLASDVMCIIMSCLCYMGLISGGTIMTVAINIALLAIGVVLMISGTSNYDAFLTNSGLITVAAVIIIRFFDWDFDIFAKGIAFIITGVILFAVNKHLIRNKKSKKEEE